MRTRDGEATATVALVLAVVAGLTMAGFAAPRPIARADPASCVEEILDVQATNGAEDTIITGAYAEANTEPVQAEGVDPNCSTARFYGAALIWNTSNDKWAEVGYAQTPDPQAPTWCIFWEVRIGTSYYGNLTNVLCPITPGTTYRWKVEYHSSDGDFHFYYDQGANGGYTIAGHHDAGFSHGQPAGRSDRVGTFTQAEDDQSNLKYSTCEGCTLGSWDGQKTKFDNISTYHRHQLSVSHYEVIHD